MNLTKKAGVWIECCWTGDTSRKEDCLCVRLRRNDDLFNLTLFSVLVDGWSEGSVALSQCLCLRVALHFAEKGNEGEGCLLQANLWRELCSTLGTKSFN